MPVRTSNPRAGDRHASGRHKSSKLAEKGRRMFRHASVRSGSSRFRARQRALAKEMHSPGRPRKHREPSDKELFAMMDRLVSVPGSSSSSGTTETARGPYLTKALKRRRKKKRKKRRSERRPTSAPQHKSGAIGLSVGDRVEFRIHLRDKVKEDLMAVAAPAAAPAPAPSPSSSSANKTAPSQFRRGQQVECKAEGWSQHYPGQITKVNANGTYDLSFPDGDRKRSVPSSRIRNIGGTVVSPAPAPASSRSAAPSQFRRGQQVECKAEGWSQHYPGQITKVNANGTYDLSFPDGDRKRGVPSSRIRNIGGGGGTGTSAAAGVESPTPAPAPAPSMVSKATSSQFRRGMRVECKAEGWSQHYPGQITKVNANGTYDLSFPDGDRKRGVPSSRIRNIGGMAASPAPSRSAAPSQFRRGQQVECKAEGWSQHYPGQITKVNANGTYDLSFPDGDRKRGVPSSRIRNIGGGGIGGTGTSAAVAVARSSPAAASARGLMPTSATRSTQARLGMRRDSRSWRHSGKAPAKYTGPVTMGCDGVTEWPAWLMPEPTSPLPNKVERSESSIAKGRLLMFGTISKTLEDGMFEIKTRRGETHIVSRKDISVQVMAQHEKAGRKKWWYSYDGGAH